MHDRHLPVFNRHNFATAVLVLASACALPARGADDADLAALGLGTDVQGEETASTPLQLGGVMEPRSLWSSGEDSPYAATQLLGVRLTAERQLTQNSRIVAHLQTDVAHSNQAQVLSQIAADPATRNRVARLSWSDKSASAHQSIGFDWLYATGKSSAFQYTLGRQPISSSLGRIWSPTDLYEPFLPNDLERLYKLGVDAAKLQWYLKPETYISTIISGGKSTKDNRKHWNWQQRIDVEAAWGKAFGLIGTREHLRYLGAGLQVNDIAGLDLYGESLVYRSSIKDPTSFSSADGYRTVLGFSKKIATNTLGTLEWLHQSEATSETGNYRAWSEAHVLTDLPYIGPGRDYLGFTVSARPHPLWGIDMAFLSNLHDRSLNSTLAIEYSLNANLRARATASLPLLGDGSTEFRRQGRALQLGLQWFF